MMEHFVHNGLTLEYEVCGSGEPFLFLHGMGGSVEQIRAVYPPLAGVQLINLNQQGHGNSEADWEHLHFDRMAEDVGALMRHLDIQQATLAGISMGAAVSLNFAVRYPEKVKKLLLIRNAWTEQPMSSEVQRAYYDLGLALKEGNIERFYASEGWKIVCSASNYTQNAFTSTFHDPPCLRFWQKYLILPKTAPIKGLEELVHLTMPVTILACRNDLCHPYEYGERLAAHIAHAVFQEIPDKDTDAAAQKICIQQAIHAMFAAGADSEGAKET